LNVINIIIKKENIIYKLFIVFLYNILLNSISGIMSDKKDSRLGRRWTLEEDIQMCKLREGVKTLKK